MAGVTDRPFRQLCREASASGLTDPGQPQAPGLFVNQMITARALVEGHRKTLKLAEFGPGETPRSIQLYGTDPNNPDTDGGGALDGAEVARGTDPLDPSDDALSTITTRSGAGSRRLTAARAAGRVAAWL